MKKFEKSIISGFIFALLLALILLITGMCMAEDYWMFISPDTKTTGAQGSNRYTGDIIDILPINAQYNPTAGSKQALTYSITKIKNISPEDIEKYTKQWISGEDMKAYRKYTIANLSKYGLNISGIKKDVLDFTAIKSDLKEKTYKDIALWQNYKSIRERSEKLWGWLTFLFNSPLAFADTENESVINSEVLGDDYETLTLWEAATDNNLVTSTTREFALCYDDDGSLDDNNCQITGATVNSSYYRKVTVPAGERHNGTVDGGGFVIDPTTESNTNGAVIGLLEAYGIIEWICVTGYQPVLYGKSAGIIFYYWNVGNQTIRNCLVHDSNGSANRSEHGIWDRSTNQTSNKIYNCMVVDIKNSGFYSNTSGSFYNCSSYGCAEGFWVDDNTPIVMNCVAMGTTTGDFGADGGEAWDGSSDYNCDEDNTAPGANSLHNKLPADNFVDVTAGQQDLHVKNASADIYNTANGTGAVFTNDIDGEERPVTALDWDIGADECTIAITATPTITLTATQTPTQTLTLSPTPTQTQTQTITNTMTLSYTPTITPTCTTPDGIVRFGLNSNCDYAGGWEDTYVNELSKDTNYGSSEDLKLTLNNTNDDKYIHFKFNTGDLYNYVDISSARVWFYVTYSTYLPVDMVMYDLQQSWVEAEDTFNIYSTGNNWTSNNGGYDDIGSSYGTNNWYRGIGWRYIPFNAAGISALESSASSGDSVNIFLEVEAIFGGSWYLASSEYGTTSLRPYVEICYHPYITPTATQTMTLTATPTPTQTLTQTLTATNTETLTTTLSPTSTNTQTVSPTNTLTLSPTNTLTLSPTQTQTATQTNTITSVPTLTLTATITATPVCSVSLSEEAAITLWVHSGCGSTWQDLDYVGTNCYGGTFIWSTDDPCVTVDENGIVTAVTVGDAYVSITCSSIPLCTDSVLVHVRDCITNTVTPTPTLTNTKTMTLTQTQTATPTQTQTETITQTLTLTPTLTITPSDQDGYIAPVDPGGWTGSLGD